MANIRSKLHQHQSSVKRALADAYFKRPPLKFRAGMTRFVIIMMIVSVLVDTQIEGSERDTRPVVTNAQVWVACKEANVNGGAILAGERISDYPCGADKR